MDFSVSMVDGRGNISTTHCSSLNGSAVSNYQTASMHGTLSQQTHLMAISSHQQIGNSQNYEQPSHQEISQQSVSGESNSNVLSESKSRNLPKHEVEPQYTPPPRVSSCASVVTHSETRVERGTDTNDFEPFIKIEIRGHLPGFTSADKDKNSVMQFHFNSLNDVLQFFSHRSVPQIDAFNILTNSDLVRNINPELVRNHFLYVPSSQESSKSSVSSIASPAATLSQVASIQGPNGSQIVVNNNAISQVTAKNRLMKPERRRGEVPPGTIINKTPPAEYNPNQFVCWICGLNLQKSLPFEEHMVEQHSIEKPYRCDDCGVTFKQKAHIDRHKRIHLPTRPYQCGVCGKGFTRNEHVRRHSFTHSGEKPYQCPTCPKSFSRQQQLTKHLISHTKPPRADSPLTLPHSGLATAALLLPSEQAGRLVAINQPAPTTLASPLVSTPAQHTSSSHGGYLANGRGRQPNGEPAHRPYQCGVCGKAFIRNEHLRRHMLIHSGEKPHACGTCGKAFPRREHLTKHLRSHLKEQEASQSPMPVAAHSGNVPSVTGVTSASSLSPASVPVSNHSNINGSLSSALTVASSQPLPAHSGSVSHSAAQVSSHPPSSTHGSHLPPGTHYLPMFGLLAEVV